MVATKDVAEVVEDMVEEEDMEDRADTLGEATTAVAMVAEGIEGLFPIPLVYSPHDVD